MECSRRPFQRPQIKGQTFKKTLHQSPSEDHGLHPILQTDKGHFWMREWALSTEELKLDVKSFMDMGRSYVYTNRANRSEINVFIFWVRESNTHRSFLAKELYVGFQPMDAQWSHRRASKRH